MEAAASRQSKLRLFFATKGGAFNGMIRDNLRELPAEMLNLSMSLTDMFTYRPTFEAFQTKFPDKEIKRDFFKIDTTMQRTLFTPFPLLSQLEEGAQGHYKEQVTMLQESKDEKCFKL